MKSEFSVCWWQSPVGMLEICIQDQSVLSIKKSNIKIDQRKADDRFQPIIQQLTEYFDGTRPLFDLPLLPKGTPFQLAVWKAIAKIPYGETRSYKEVAAMIGKPAAARAVGNALNKNPLCIVVPCHRVTATDGVGGYAWGLTVKKKLLSIEGA